jgi:hypothetical protein
MPASPLENAGAPDDLRISITTENEVRFWTKTLDCTEGQMRAAIAAAGPMLKAVRQHLRATS